MYDNRLRETVIGEHAARWHLTCEAEWRRGHYSPHIVSIHDHGVPTFTTQAGTPCPELADARERWPDLAPLWDAIRRELWIELHSAAKTFTPLTPGGWFTP